MCDFFSDRLKEERKRLGLIQDEMARIAGVAKSSYCNYEAGSREPTASFFANIAAAGADVTYILTGERSAGRQPEAIAEEVAGVLYVIESVLETEKGTFPPKFKAEMLYTAYIQITPEERRMMLKALEEGTFMLPLSVARLFGFRVG